MCYRNAVFEWIYILQKDFNKSAFMHIIWNNSEISSQDSFFIFHFFTFQSHFLQNFLAYLQLFSELIYQNSIPGFLNVKERYHPGGRIQKLFPGSSRKFRGLVTLAKSQTETEVRDSDSGPRGSEAHYA